MSFKREGDDSSQLNILKKRRVADLLSNFIPEDEAALMKNGRYTCLVCSHRPVFDTVDMLTVHRKGKRHLEGLKWFYGKKTKLQNEIEKRRHQNYLQAEEGRQEAANPAPLLTQTRSITHHALLKSTPYSSCHKKINQGTKSEKGSCSFGSDYKSISLPRSSLLNQTPPAEAVDSLNMDAKSPPTPGSSTKDCHRKQPSEKKQEAARKKSQPTAPSEPEPMSAQRRRELEHYLKLKSSGWLQDKNGSWVKDENVEFDSDEDQPPLLQSNGSPDILEKEQL